MRNRAWVFVWFKWIFLSSLLLVSILLIGLFIYERWSRTYLARLYQPPGQLVDIGGRKLHLHCVGDGEVTVVLEDGLTSSGSLFWGKVQPDVGKFTRVCAYDRAGIMWSESSSQPPTSEQIAQDLHTALEQASINPPYVLVGLSIGGIYTRVFAELYPEEVIGMVLVDSSHPEQEERFPPAPVNLNPPPIILWLNRQLAASGVLRLLNNLPKANAKRIPPEMLPQLKAFNPQSMPAVLAERQLVPANLRRAQQMLSLGDCPLVVLTAAKPKNLDEYPPGFTEEYLQQEAAVWQELQVELATLSSKSRHVISTDSGHLMYFDRPELIIDAIRDVLNEVS